MILKSLKIITLLTALTVPILLYSEHTFAATTSECKPAYQCSCPGSGIQKLCCNGTCTCGPETEIWTGPFAAGVNLSQNCLNKCAPFRGVGELTKVSVCPVTTGS